MPPTASFQPPSASFQPAQSSTSFDADSKPIVERESELVQPEKPQKKEPERRVINLPDEPELGNADATNIGFRMPLSGERV